MCAITQNKIQKDNIKIQLFDKRFIVYQSFLDSITIIKRDNWDRYILFNGNDVSQQMMQLEDNLYKSVQLSFCLFDKELCSKIVDVNNAFTKVAESYKDMLVANKEHFTSQNEMQEFTNLLNTHILSKKGFNTPEYEDALKKQFPRTYISIMDFNKECSAYLSFVDKCGIIKDFRKYIFIDKLGYKCKYNCSMPSTNRIEYKRELTSELDIEKEVVALFHETTFARCVYM